MIIQDDFCNRNRVWLTETFFGPNCFKISLTIVYFTAPVPLAKPTTIDYDLDLTTAINPTAMMFEGVLF